MTKDPMLSLAISVQSNKGVFALLLGSGVSRSAGIPTGWEVVQDLIRKLAHLKNQPCEPAPEAWFQEVYKIPPNYSKLLNDLAKSSGERMQLLRGYFEPTEEERQEGRKLPTKAHRAIADLVANGYIRVIVTTNFDRLLEQALADLGIQPYVIATTDAAAGSLPLAHSRCSIIKLNGDYLDTRLKNTEDELKSYKPQTDRLLKQVFDEYGLIVCGWSGDYDTALRSRLERCPSRRFSTYWATKSKLTDKAKDLANLRQATTLQIVGADEFFKKLNENVQALAEFEDLDVLSSKIAVSRMKKYLANDSNRILLHDLLSSESEKAYAAFASDRFEGSETHWNLEENALKWLRSYESATDTLLNLMVCVGYWGELKHDEVLGKCFKRIADQTGGHGRTEANNLRRYPALLLLYGIGLAALASSNYRLLRNLLYMNIRQDDYSEEEPVVAKIHHQEVLEYEMQKKVLGNLRTPLSDHLYEALRVPLKEYLPGDKKYDETFNWFEYLLGLCHCDSQLTRPQLAENLKNPHYHAWAPVGRYAWKNSSPGILVETEVMKGKPYPEKVAALVRDGFFESGGQHDDKFIQVKKAFDRCVQAVRSKWMYS